ALLLISLSAEFYKLKWNMGSGGGMSIQTGPYIYLTPSGVQKERLAPAQLFVFHTGDTTSSPYWAYQPAGMKPSSSNEVFLWLHQHHEAKCVIHTHSLYSNLATRQPQQTNEDTWWTIDNQEYLKGIPSYPESHCYKNTDNLHIPIIPNKPTEAELSPDLREAARKNKVPCILVKNHGAYHFGKSWEQTKMSAECLEYLFEL
ncbi:putative methylthioribulose-1-phosphate dehydratase-like protein, partial [Protomyces lactucae-debilis]